jgi:hypothetical protein
MATITDLETNTTGANSRTIINTNFDNLNAGKAEVAGQVMTGQLSWSQTNSFGLKIQSLTTAQRNALTPANGHVIYNTTESEFQVYENGVWQALRASAAHASATTEGITKLSVAPADADNPIAVGDNDSRVLSTANATKVAAITASAAEINQLDNAVISAAQLTEAGTFFNATNITGAEAETLTDGSNADTLHVHAQPFRLTTAIASDVLRYSADTERNTTAPSPTKLKEILVNFSGTIRVKFDFKADTAVGGTVRVYKNGSGHGTQQAATADYQTFSEDLAFSSGDLIQLYAANTYDPNQWTYVKNFRLYYTFSDQAQAVVNTD